MDEFKQQAIKSGYSEQEVDEYLTNKGANSPKFELDKSAGLDINPNQFNLEAGKPPIVDMEIPKLEAPQARPVNQDTIPNQQAVPEPQTIQPTQQTSGNSPILSQSPTIGTQFGAKQSADIYSGGVNYGTDFIVPKGTKITAPPGKWKVVSAFNGAKAEGPKNSQRGINQGYGNSVLLENTETGEKMRFSHLTIGGVAVKPGQEVSGGDVIGLSGATGNTAGQTGQHLDLEYYNSKGRISDVMRTPYAQYLR